MRTENVIALVLVCCGVFATSNVQAARFVRISVELDGRPVLEGHSSDNGFETPYLVWRRLKEASLTPTPPFDVEPEPGQPGKAVLRGDISVDVRYGAIVQTNELPLVLAAGKWQVDPAWVESHGPAGNLADEQRKTEARRLAVLGNDLKFPLVAIGLGGLVLLCAILAVVVLLSWRKPGSVPE